MDFSGSTAETTSSLVNTTTPTLNANVPVNSAVYDMRQYSSYYLTVTPTTLTAPTANQNVLQVITEFFADINATIPVEQNNTSFFIPQAVSTGTQFLGGSYFQQDQCRGPFVRLTFTNTVVDPFTATYQLIGSTRPITTFFAQQQFDEFGTARPDGLISLGTNVLAAGAVDIYSCTFCYGKMGINLENPTGSNTIKVAVGPAGGFDVVNYTVAAGVNDYREFICPRSSPQVFISCVLGTAGHTYTYQLVSLYDRIV